MDVIKFDRLKAKLKRKMVRAELRYKYYENKFTVQDFGISTPPKLANVSSKLGWCNIAVDNLADRLVFKEFKDDIFDMNEIFRTNNPDVFFDSAILSALITSCCFVYISKDENENVRLQIIDGKNATGTIDPITGLLTEGYAVLDSNENGAPILEAYFDKDKTVYYKNGEKIREEANPTNHPLLVPIIYKPDAVRPFGHSVITRSCIDLIQSACRTLKRTEISAEFYSYPQKYVTGLSNNFEDIDKWKASMSAMMIFTKDEDGDRPNVGQFNQQSMAPHIEELRSLASAFAGETGLTLDDLGFATDNPSSAEAIKASHEALRLKARKAQRCFGTGFLNVGYLAVCLRDDFAYLRSQLYLTKPTWEPIFEPDAAMLSSIGDGAIKINQAVPGYFDKSNLRGLTGIEASNIEPLETSLTNENLEAEGE